MRRATTALALAAALIGLASPALAINCEQARKYAATGRSADDIADTMVADPDEVKKCLAGGSAGAAGGAAGSGGGAASGGSGASAGSASGGATGSAAAGSAGSAGSGSGQAGH
jgi:hypothetical protein